MIWLDKNSPVVENELSILYKLQEECIKRGKHYFHSGFKVKGSEIMMSCPVHKFGQERRASSSLTTVAKRRPDGSQIDAGTFHCFACKTVMNFPEFVSYCLGVYDNGQTGDEWIRSNFTIGYSMEYRKLSMLSREPQKPPTIYVPESELDKYRYYHDYMFKRGLTEQIIERYDVGFDPNFRLSKESPTTPSVTFPVKDITGGTIFVARRAIKSKLFHYVEDASKPLYGLYELYRDNGLLENPGHTVPFIVICESVFNTLTCVKWGFPSVALLGTGSSQQYPVIDRLPCEKLYLCLDPDAAGNSGTEKLIKNLNRNNIFVIDLPEKRDVNDVSEQVFRRCFDNATLSFMWKKKYSW